MLFFDLQLNIKHIEDRENVDRLALDPFAHEFYQRIRFAGPVLHVGLRNLAGNDVGHEVAVDEVTVPDDEFDQKIAHIAGRSLEPVIDVPQKVVHGQIPAFGRDPEIDGGRYGVFGRWTTIRISEIA